ncbi:phosphoenolpyruvate--protein phosphotransferase, partial [Rhizobium sp. SEMIA 4085]|uniref:putative PEP-binding protein n=1 Tax=Rhizobium sp. SEMIA 4085 TaxID=2137761 RepID=UPI001478CEAE
MAERDSLKATSASSGVAYGPVHLGELPDAALSSRPQSASGYQALMDAIETSVDELEALAGRSDAESRDIIDFQIEVLRDPTIAETAEARMNAGENIVFAWAGTLDDYIGELETADEEQVRARAVDILDIKNRVLCALTGTPIADFPAGSIFVGRDMEPSRFLAHDWSGGGGIALFNGSAIGHVALLARAKSIPMVVNAGRFAVSEGDYIRVDADSGAVAVHADGARVESASPQSISTFTHASPCDNGEVRTADGTRILLSINVNDPAELDSVEPVTTAGIGLMRSEFAVSSVADAASEEKQIVIYRRLLKWAAGKPVIVRMLDIGGDKPLAGLGVPPAGPTTDLRGIRLLLAHPEIARVQARALLRAAVHGDLRVMLPMVTFPSEINEMRSIFHEEAVRLATRGIPHPIPAIGMMVEVPAAAVMLDTFETADFFSFGTNDLTQHLAASSRDGANSTVVHRATIPALFRFLEGAMRLAAKGGKPVSICGDIAGAPLWLAGLIAIGVRPFSVAPLQLPAIGAPVV